MNPFSAFLLGATIAVGGMSIYLTAKADRKKVPLLILLFAFEFVLILLFDLQLNDWVEAIHSVRQ